MEKRRLIHGGLVIAMVVISMSLTLLVLGATRNSQSNFGLPGSMAMQFNLRDGAGRPFSLGDDSVNATVLIFPGHSGSAINSTDVINNLIYNYRNDRDVEIMCISSVQSLSILGPSGTRTSDLQIKCRDLHIAYDLEGNVARDYRVSGNPVMIIIDKNHKIFSRIQLNSESAELEAVRDIQALRPMRLNSLTPTELPPTQSDKPVKK